MHTKRTVFYKCNWTRKSKKYFVPVFKLILISTKMILKEKILRPCLPRARFTLRPIL